MDGMDWDTEDNLLVGFFSDIGVSLDLLLVNIDLIFYSSF